MAGRRIFLQLTAWGALALLAGAGWTPAPPCAQKKSCCPVHVPSSGPSFAAANPDCCRPAPEALPNPALTQVQRPEAQPLLAAGPGLSAPPVVPSEPTLLVRAGPPPRGAGPPLFVLYAALLI